MFPSQKPFRGIQLNKTHPLARGLVGCWVFNEMTGNTVFDMSGNGNDGTIVGADWVPDGLSFDGSGDYVTIPEIDLSQGGTIIQRVRADDISADRAGIGGDIFPFTYMLWIDNAATDHFAIAVYTGSWQVRYGNIVPVAGNWYDFAFTYTSGTSKIFIDGRQDGADLSATMASANFPIKIGRTNNNLKVHEGDISYVYIYNRALSPYEVAWLNREPYLFFEPVVSPASLYYETPSGLSIPVAMNHYKQMMG